MSALIDVIASMFFSGALFLIVLDANGLATETQMVYNGDQMVQQMLTSTAQLVEGEMRNIGYGVPSTVANITRADSSTISFLSDVDRDGTIDTVTYWIGPVSELTSTSNELDRFLKRSVTGQGISNVGVVTVFHLNYYTKAGDTLHTPVLPGQLPEIFTVELTMEVQNAAAPYRDSSMVKAGERNALYSSSLWQQTRLSSQNNRR
jgi:hypothetical protein